MNIRTHLLRRPARRAAAVAVAFASAAAIGAGAAGTAHAASSQSWAGAGSSYFVGEDGHRVMLRANPIYDNGTKAFSLSGGTYHVGRSDGAKAQNVVVTFQLQQSTLGTKKVWRDAGWPVKQTVQLNGSTAAKDVMGPTLPLTHRVGSGAKLYRVVVDFRWTLPNDPDVTLGRRTMTPSLAGEAECPPGTLVPLTCAPFADDDGSGNAGLLLV
ncbi:MAG: hypothetical protein QM747_20235 [Nocardioides sp.]